MSKEINDLSRGSSATSLRLQGIEVNSVVNGDGLRIVIFLQGCHHRCKSCQNPQTWDFNGGKFVSIDKIMEVVHEHKNISTGITISGGEPLIQCRELKELLERVKKETDLTVWLYTGYEFENIPYNAFNERIMLLTDVLVEGKFREELLDTSPTPRGSTNQRIIKNPRLDGIRR